MRVLLNLLLIGALALVLAGCGTSRYPAVLLDEKGDNRLMLCEMQKAPNGEELLFCGFDSRGTW